MEQSPAPARSSRIRRSSVRLKLLRRERASVGFVPGRRAYVTRRALAAADAVGVSAAFVVSTQVEQGGAVLGEAWLAIPLILVWLLLFRTYGLYGGDERRPGHSTAAEFPPLFHAIVFGGLATWAYLRMVTSEPLALWEVSAFGVLSFVLIIGFRAVVRRAISTGWGPKPTLIIGDGILLASLLRKLATHPEYGLKPVALLSSADAHHVDIPVVGQNYSAKVPDLVRDFGIEHVIAMPAAEDQPELHDLLERCRRERVGVTLVPRNVDAMGPNVTIGDIEGITAIGLSPLGLSRSSRAIKRTVDIVGSALGLLILSPVMLVAMVAIRTETPGPIIFRQKRVGLRGKTFEIYKFRSMVDRAEEARADLVADSSDPHWLLLDNDPRITRVGKVIRKLSIDELPQLWNVLRGDMSLVGPRPLIPEEHGRVVGWETDRLDLRPGVTGLWQVLGRTAIPFEEMVKLDYLYVTNWSLWNDLMLLLRTLPAVFRRRGAN
jgi:exopolysaccharide biosynthesis polyprenyl glycosylphosphotransferase